MIKGSRSLGIDSIKIKKGSKEVFDYLAGKVNLYRKVFANRYEDTVALEAYDNIGFDTILSIDFLKPLKDIDKGAKCISEHMAKGSRILICSDYDADGTTSATVGKLMFDNVLCYDNVEVLVNRREYGNGINNTIRDIMLQIHEDNPFDLLITSDHSSSDLRNLRLIKEKTGIDMVLTDHHLYKDEECPLPIANAFINPQRPDSTFSKNMTGTAVLYLVLVYTYLKHIEDKSDERLEKMFYYISYVGMTTISDCVDLKDFINRKFINKTLEILNSKTIEQNAFWSTVLKRMKKGYYISATTLSFELIAIINTPGRIDNPRLSFEFMSANDEETAEVLFEKMNILNDTRKSRQNKVLEKKDHKVFKTDDTYVMLADGAKDIQGIIANRILFDDGYKIAIVFAKSPSDDNLLLGSGRMDNPNLNLKEIVDRIADRSDIVISHGGHASAIGIKIKNDLEGFYNLLREESECSCDITPRDDSIMVDEVIYSNKKLILTLSDIKEMAPFGIGFKEPVFVSDTYLSAYRIFDKGTQSFLSGRVKLSNESDFKVAFFYSIKASERDELLENIKRAKRLRIIYKLGVNSFRNKNKIQLNAIKVIPFSDNN